MSNWSLRSRLVVWTLLLEVLMLGAGVFFWYRSQEVRLHTDLDATLQGVAAELSWLLTATPGADPCTMLDTRFRQPKLVTALGLYAADGALLCSVGAYPAPGSTDAARPDRAERPLFSTVGSAAQGPLRILSYPIVDQGHGQQRLEVIRSLKSLEQRLRQLLGRSLGWLAGVLVVSGIAQWLLLKRLLAPLGEITSLARRAGAKNLAERLKPSRFALEMSELELAFNEMLNRLEQSVSRTMQFTATASHELRTPLTILRGEIEIALRRSGLNEEIRALLTSNLEEINRMSRIIEDLLVLSKSDVGEMPLRTEALELNELLTDLFGQAAVLGEEKDIAVSFYPAPEQIFFQGDGLRLRQLFLNLLSNAIHYTPSGGSVKMTLQRQADQALISVSDSGIGIASEHLPHIFERFYRVDKIQNNGDGGSGLGLSIAKWVVDAHGGEITAKSRIGQGTEFQISLPLTRP